MANDTVATPTHLDDTLLTTPPTPKRCVGEATCACKGKKKPCLFVHGVGNKDSSAPTPTFSDTWGDVQNSAPCCSSFAFAHYESVRRGWTRPEVQTEFCNTALSIGTSGGKTIDNVILVTFSMGNLVAAGAIANDVCKLGDGVTWVAIAGPMQGSKAANLLEKKCSACGMDGALFGLCPVTEPYFQMKAEDTVDANLKKAFQDAQTARKRANKVLCGINSSGLASLASPVLSSIGAEAFPPGTLQDGVVDFDSCSVGFSKFSTDAEAGANYKASINHFDTSFRNGDGWWGADRMPVKWFECAL
ncbi:hypothetical protein SDRG_13401 [Saprolegnia diclina VS20]|uniref:Uncharacterized protein n=1 Tax=Saprolegnia diclina (strain VS20) TaxID=1156394 RepID=T0Q2W9_SAPDV|nr:hypothetical protein SDRG_13401 [Saprolegnia diclina VS20]EQC28891.1 hypothetical protein SDRG_13401 [Saprolegnia diclina VS20]|eukprot:XP_008617708.1 hypothetical protein SDRG_13401 [Saprolegnia diclina VS20]